MTRLPPGHEHFPATLVTVFDGPVAEDRLNNLSMWLWQEQFEGFEDLDCRFEYGSDDRSISCRLSVPVPEVRLPLLAAQIDKALSRIVHDVGFKTVVHRP